MFFDFGGWAIDDVSTIYMVYVAKYSSFAFSYHDGGKDISEIKSQHLQKQRIVELPSLLEYASYIYFYPTTIVGPFIEYKDFINFIDLTDCYANLKNNLGYIFYQGTEKLLLGIFYIIFFALFTAISGFLCKNIIKKTEKWFNNKYLKYVKYLYKSI